MMYLLKLENLKNGQEAFITVSARASVESLSPRIKVALQLPYTDRGWHRFVARGTTYIMEELIIAEQEIMWENDNKPGHYRCSDHISVGRIFTCLGSSILYTQDGSWAKEQKVRCTFVQRIFDEKATSAKGSFKHHSARRSVQSLPDL